MLCIRKRFLDSAATDGRLIPAAINNFLSFLLKTLLVASCSWMHSSPALSGPVRVASLNLCTDQLVLALADHEQIVSITFLSRHRQSSYMAHKALDHHVNYGQAEELISLRPDLVVSLAHTSSTAIRLLKHLGFQVELFPPADSIADVESNVERMAELLGQAARGRSILEKMAMKLDSITTATSPQAALRGVLFEPNGYTAGRQTLRGEIMRLSGWQNIAEEVGIEGVGVIGLETLTLADPDRVVLSPYAPGTHSLGQRVLDHPAVRAVGSSQDPLVVPPRLWMCGGPMNIEAVARLIDGR